MTDSSRRHFIRKTAAATVSLGLLPSIGCAKKGIANAASPVSNPGSSSASNPASNPAPVPEILEACNITTLDLFGEGPFYSQNPPVISNSLLASAKEPGERLIIRGRLFNIGCSEILPNTVIDVWHANAAGQYDNVGRNLRGQTLTDEQGFFRFETVRPGKYLNGLRYRPAHIHFKITPPGSGTLTTQLYFEGDPDLASDAATKISSGRFDASDRIIPLSKKLDGRLEGVFDIVVRG